MTSFLAELPELGVSDSDAADYDHPLRFINHLRVRMIASDLLAAESEAAGALRQARREKDERGIALAGLALALAYLARGRYADARKLLADAARSFTRAGDALRQVQAHYLLGEIAYLAEDPIRAGSHYRDALAVARGAGLQEWIELLTLKFEHR